MPIGWSGLRCVRGRFGWQSPSGASWVQLGLIVDVLDDRLAKLWLRQAFLHAGQRVADDVTGREGGAFEPGLSGKPGQPLVLLFSEVDRRPVVGPRLLGIHGSSP